VWGLGLFLAVSACDHPIPNTIRDRETLYSKPQPPAASTNQAELDSYPKLRIGNDWPPPKVHSKPSWYSDISGHREKSEAVISTLMTATQLRKPLYANRFASFGDGGSIARYYQINATESFVIVVPYWEKNRLNDTRIKIESESAPIEQLGRPGATIGNNPRMKQALIAFLKSTPRKSDPAREELRQAFRLVKQ